MEKRDGGGGGTSGKGGTGESTSGNSGVMDLQSGEDGLEVNMSDVMDQIQSLPAQYVIRREVKADLSSWGESAGGDFGGLTEF